MKLKPPEPVGYFYQKAQFVWHFDPHTELAGIVAKCQTKKQAEKLAVTLNNQCGGIKNGDDNARV